MATQAFLGSAYLQRETSNADDAHDGQQPHIVRS
jgi:hypothetical protein